MPQVRGGGFTGPTGAQLQQQQVDSLSQSLQNFAKMRENRRQFNITAWMSQMEKLASTNPLSYAGVIAESPELVKPGLNMIFGAKLTDSVYEAMKKGSIDPELLMRKAQSDVLTGKVQPSQVLSDVIQETQAQQQLASMLSGESVEAPKFKTEPVPGEQTGSKPTGKTMPAQTSKAGTPQSTGAAGMSAPPGAGKKSLFDNLVPTSPMGNMGVPPSLFGLKIPGAQKEPMAAGVRAPTEKPLLEEIDITEKPGGIAVSLQEQAPLEQVPASQGAQALSSYAGAGVPDQANKMFLSAVAKKESGQEPTPGEKAATQKVLGGVVWKIADEAIKEPADARKLIENSVYLLNFMQKNGDDITSIKANPVLANLFLNPARIEQGKLEVANAELELKRRQLEHELTVGDEQWNKRYQMELDHFNRTYNLELEKLGVDKAKVLVDMLAAQAVASGKSAMSPQEKALFDTLEKEYFKLWDANMLKAKGDWKAFARSWENIKKDPRTKDIITRYETTRDALIFGSGAGTMTGEQVEQGAQSLYQQFMQGYGK